MNVENLVTTLDTSIRLKSLGLTSDTLFSYYKNEDEILTIDFTDLKDLNYLCPAYTSEELIRVLPDILDFENEKFGIIESKSHKFITDTEDTSPFITIQSIKFGELYITRYVYKERCVDYKTSDNSLLIYDNSESESRAKLIIKLYEYDLINNEK